MIKNNLEAWRHAEEELDRLWFWSSLLCGLSITQSVMAIGRILRWWD